MRTSRVSLASLLAANAISIALLVRVFIGSTRSGGVVSSHGYLAELKEGFAYLWRDRLVRAIVAMVVVTNMLDAGMAGVLSPVYADRVLEGGLWLRSERSTPPARSVRSCCRPGATRPGDP